MSSSLSGSTTNKSDMFFAPGVVNPMLRRLDEYMCVTALPRDTPGGCRMLVPSFLNRGELSVSPLHCDDGKDSNKSLSPPCVTESKSDTSLAAVQYLDGASGRFTFAYS